MSEASDWTLTPVQQMWMAVRRQKIYAAYVWLRSRNEGIGKRLIDELIADGFADVFGDMSWDEAYDRYETMTEQDA